VKGQETLTKVLARDQDVWSLIHVGEAEIHELIGAFLAARPSDGLMLHDH